MFVNTARAATVAWFNEYDCRRAGATHARLLLRTLIGLIGSKGLKMEVIESEPRYEGGDVYRRQTGYESLHMSFGR